MPNNFESQKSTARNLVLAYNSQATPGETLADNKFVRRQRFDPGLEVELIPTRRNDKDQAGKGTEFATDSDITNWDSKVGSLKAQADDALAGYLFAFLMGADTVTGDMAPYTHAIAWDESTTQAKMTNLWIQDTADLKRKYLDLSVSDVTLSYSEKGALGIEATLMGCGRYADDPLTSVPALADYQYLYNPDTVLSMGPVGSLAAFTSRFLSGQLKLSSAVVPHTAPGTGAYGAFMRTGLRKFSFDWIIAAKETDDVNTLLTGDTMSGLTIVTSSGDSVLSVTIPKFKMKAVPIGKQENMVIWKCSLDETTALKVPGGADAISVSVVNSVASYLASV